MNLQSRWLLCHRPNFKYCTVFVSGMELRTDTWADRQTDDPITHFSQFLTNKYSILMNITHKNTNEN